MLKQLHTRFMLFLFLADLALTLVALQLAQLARTHLPLGEDTRGVIFLNPGVFLAVAVIWPFFLRFFGAYDSRRTLTLMDELKAVVPAVAMATLTFTSYLFVFKVAWFSRGLVAYFCIFDLLLLTNLRWIARLVMRSLTASGHYVRRLLIVGAGPVGTDLARLVQQRDWIGFRLVGYLDDDPAKLGRSFHGAPVLGTTADLQRVLREHAVDDVIIALPARAHEKMAQLVLSMQALPVRVRVVPDLFGMVTVRAQVEDFFGYPLIGLRDPVITGFDRVVKRTFDLVIASLALVITAPIMLAAALAIWIESGRPIIFKQTRIGENGRPFSLYKFRTMVHDAEALLPRIRRERNGHKWPDDPRVTRVGRILRRTSIDELPNLFNVLKGEMSLVGPRPEQPWIVEQYEPWQRKRLAATPGMTGWWQINGRSDLPMHLNTEYDLYYIQNYSPLLDLIILLKTIGVVLRGKGAY
jgi:exopolysaccharide biosynthesis polyprenyl glycosylphosphotransferase